MDRHFPIWDTKILCSSWHDISKAEQALHLTTRNRTSWENDKQFNAVGRWKQDAEIQKEDEITEKVRNNVRSLAQRNIEEEIIVRRLRATKFECRFDVSDGADKESSIGSFSTRVTLSGRKCSSTTKYPRQKRGTTKNVWYYTARKIN